MKKTVPTFFTISCLLSTVFLMGLALNVQIAEADHTWTETIYIRTDGSIEPDTAPISTVDNITYTLTDNIVGDIPEGESAIAVYKDDIVIDGSSRTVQGTGAENSWAIWLWNRSNVTIKNIEVANFHYGIFLYYSTNTTLLSNAASNNGYNFGVVGDDMSEFIHDIDTSNTVDGKPIYYLVDEADAIIDAQTNAGTVYLINCNNITVGDLTLTKNLHGVSLVNTVDSKIENITVSANQYGITLDMSSDSNAISGNNISANDYLGLRLVESSNNNTISENNIEDNPHAMLLHRSSNNTVHGNHVTKNTYGMRLTEASNTNTVSGNTLLGNSLYGLKLIGSSGNKVSGNNVTTNNLHGIWLHESSRNTICGNNVAYSLCGILLDGSFNNTISNNNFVNNTQQIESHNSTNTWDDGAEGNFWSDYEERYPDAEEMDGSGIWDTSYVIDENNRDNYPIVPEFPSILILPLLMALTLGVAVLSKKNFLSEGSFRKRKLCGFESHPPHHHVEIIGGFVRVILGIVLRLPEDFTAIVVFSGDEFKARID